MPLAPGVSELLTEALLCNPTDPVDEMITACYREMGHKDPTLCETLVEGLRSGALVRWPDGRYTAPDAG